MRQPPAQADAGRGRLPADAITRLLISFLIALLLWGWVTTQRNPPQSRTIAELPIAAPQLPDEDLQIGGELGNVTIQVEGPRSIVEGIERADLEPTLDLSGVAGPGEYTVPVVVDLPPAARVERIDPPQLSIVVDERSVRQLPLAVEAEEPADGTREIGEIVPEVSEVTVEGPQRLVEQVDRVVLPIEIDDRTTTFTGQFPPVAVNEEGTPIPEVAVRPRRVMTTVEVEASGRILPVLVQTVGSPAPGYELGDYAVDPRVVVLDGPEDVLNSMVAVQTAPISVEGATSSISAQVGLAELPPGVRVVEPSDGQVTAVIQVRERGVSQTLADLPVEVSGVAPGLEATVRPATVAIVVVGAEDELAALRAADVVPRASVAGLWVGEHEVDLTVELPSGVQWVRTEPDAVTVALRPAGPVLVPATPEAQPTREMP